MDVKQIRRENLLGLIRANEGKIARLARVADANASLLSQIKNGTRDMGYDLARALEKSLELQRGWMDAQQFPAGTDPVTVMELAQIAAALPERKREAWIEHGRLLMQSEPAGPNQPFNNLPPRRKEGTQ